MLVSRPCRADDFESAWYKDWCAQFRETPRLHRKQWEFCYILQALAERGLLCEGAKGLGFGVGREPLAAVVAKLGVSVIATDQETSSAIAKGWAETNQHAASLSGLNDRGICPPDAFERRVVFETADMNDKALSYRDFDFVWSSCVIEHLGSIRNGLDFLERSLGFLRSGGVSIHTTEFNCVSDHQTLETENCVIFRKRDFLALQSHLAGRATLHFDWELGKRVEDAHIDLPPYTSDLHLKLQLENHVTTSFGLILTKA